MAALPFSRPLIDKDCRIDFYAGNDKAMEQILPIYNALPSNRQGTIYPRDFGNYLPGMNPLVITNPDDLSYVFYAGEDDRPFLMLEFEHHNQTRGLLGAVGLFLCKEPSSVIQRTTYASNFQIAKLYTDAATAVNGIEAYIHGTAPVPITKCRNKSIGLMYVAFGEKAMHAVRHSVATMKRLGVDYPVCVVGDQVSEEFVSLLWEGQSPFDATQKRNFQFRAGRIKPYLYDLSPFDYTLYMDADTEFYHDVFPGFDLMNTYQFAIAQELLTVEQLYNKSLAGWEINIQERDYTMDLLNNGKEPFINSGVFFFSKNETTKKLFTAWGEEWLRYQQWDEQLALMRAIASSKPKVKYLPTIWNNPYATDDSIIFHDYGRGSIRMNVS